MLTLRPITPADNPVVAQIVRTVMPEFGCVGEGFSINDPELEDMYTTYHQPRSAFYVLEEDGMAVGVGGYAPLAGGDGSVCELRKMYLLPAARGKGGGKLIMEACLSGARKAGFAAMYLETVTAMTTAAQVYRRYGFELIDGPMGATGHGGCDRFMLKSFR